ncbi:MAG: flavin reductase family protein [Gammaproteobacteria bacterium]|nr:flavin reductase family protein [Gammaproteobacteria bacterium]MCY4217908.1 flavin reductase family protein [Gammaproteobacteria bacterium]MCY4275233.1 flavin reductase family protein [Gammaproteobacteria bacterium]
MLINLAELNTPNVYFTMTQTVLPRPIAWVLSENQNGSLNLAPFSYFNAVCSDPPLVMISIGLQDDGSHKDTLRNALERPDLVIHIASSGQLPDLNLSSATLPPEVSEVEAGDLELSDVENFHLPRLKDCKVAFMSHVHKIEQIGTNNQQHLVFAEIDSIYVSDDCVQYDNKNRLSILADQIHPLSRLGANAYASFGEVMIARRPS